MARPKRTTRREKEVGLTTEEIGIAAARMMAAAEVHQRAAVWCKNNPDAQLPNIDAIFFLIVSFELVLLSVEQSLRLLLLLQYSIVRNNTNHNPRVLYSEILNQSRRNSGIEQDILKKMNAVAQANGLAPFSETESRACLRKHDSSYSTLRYFQLDRHARLSNDWEITPRDQQVVHCLALGLILLNEDEMQRRGIGALRSVSPTPESAMTEELKALKERLMSH